VSGVLLRFGGIVFIVLLAIWLYCLLDAITSDATRVRSLSKPVWVMIVLFTFEIGALLWLLYGRPRTGGRSKRLGPAARRDAWANWPRPTPGRPRAEPARPAPDDDPDFLAGLDRRANDEHQELLQQWEADLRKREEELRRKDEDGSDGSGEHSA
jgi:hypothetical protein